MKRFAILLAVLAGCGASGSESSAPGDDNGAGAGVGGTGATCPTDAPLTWDNFGQQFFKTWCTRCHSATSPDRMGAPTGFNWDVQATVDQHLDDIAGQAASGPNGTNRLMPFTPPDPPDAERAKLGQFIACEKMAH